MLTEESLNRFIIAKCQCNENIWRIGEKIVYVCDEYSCWPMNDEEGEEDAPGT